MDSGSISTVGILSRTKIIDDEIRKLLSNRKKSVIINLAVGLDTRVTRLNRIDAHWYDIDFPEVIQMRSNYFEQNERITFLPESIVKYEWMEKIDTSDAEHVIIIAEGLLMYFSETEVRKLFDTLCMHFPGAHMFFDVVHTYFGGKKISAEFRWGIDRSEEIEKYSNKLLLKKSWSAGELNKKRQSNVMRILNILPSTRNRSQILHVMLGVKGENDA